MKIEGVTYNNSGAILGSCQCFLFKYNSTTHVFTPTGSMTTSNATTGAYSFTGIADADPAYCVAFFKDGAPNVFDVTDRNLVPVSEAWTPTTPGSRLEYWWDASQANSCFSDTGMTTPCVDGGRVVRFKDWSGKNQHLQQSNANIAPLFSVSDRINGLQVIHVAPTDAGGHGTQYMDMIGTPVSMTMPFITFTVFKAIGTFPTDTPGLWVNGSCILMQRHVAMGDKCNFFSEVDAHAAQSTIRPIADGVDYALYAKQAATGIALKVTGDATEVTALSAVGAPIGFHLGPWDPADSNTKCNVFIGEIFGISNYTAGDVTGALAYILAKWGVAL